MNTSKRGAPIKRKDFEISKRIKAARKDKFTQQSLADALGVSLQTIKNWEQERNLPDDEMLKKIAEMCNVDFLWIKNLDVKSIIDRSKEILKNFDPNKCECVSFPSPREEARSYALIYALTMCGYKIEDILDKKQYSEYMEASIKNSIEFYMNNLNKKGE